MYIDCGGGTSVCNVWERDDPNVSQASAFCCVLYQKEVRSREPQKVEYGLSFDVLDIKMVELFIQSWMKKRTVVLRHYK